MDEQTLREQLYIHIDALDAEQLPAALEAIEALAARPAPAGTYPPRLVAPVRSYWLREGETVPLVRNVLFARRRGEACALVSTSKVADTVRVNGKSLYGIEQRLQDGDFVQCEGERFFFQADPVADKLARAGAPHNPQDVSDAVRQRVLLSRKGMTFLALEEKADNKHFQWDEISCLRIRDSEDTTSIYVDTTGASVSAFGSLFWMFRTYPFGGANAASASFDNTDVLSFVEWLRAAAPFDLSIDGGYHIRHLFADPYLTFGERLIARGGASLPANADFIRGKPLPQQMRPFWIGIIASALIMLVGCCVSTIACSGAFGEIPAMLPFSLLLGGGGLFLWLAGGMLGRKYYIWREPDSSPFEKWLEPKDKR